MANSIYHKPFWEANRSSVCLEMIWYDIYLAAIGFTPGGSGTAHIYTQTVHRIQRTEHT